ncbi:MAG: hypothetical protein C4326_07370 [Ignavibacteria bacterium]
MNIEYLAVLLATLAAPLLLSRDKNISLWKYRRALLTTLAVISFVYWIWDLIAAARGHWSFNPHYVIGVWVLELPLEEYLFFPVVAFVSIFVWESVKYFLRKD